MKLKAQIMDEAALWRALTRISHEIVERNRGVENVVLVGIRRRGEPIAQRIRGNIHKIEDRDVPCGSLDIKFYRDDLSKVSEQPETRRAALPFDVVRTVVRRRIDGSPMSAAECEIFCLTEQIKRLHRNPLVRLTRSIADRIRRWRNGVLFHRLRHRKR